MSLVAFRKLGDVNRPFNLSYAALKNWGRFELVNNPADSELVFEIRFAAPFSAFEPPMSLPELTLTIFDSKTHFVLWTVSEPVEGAIRKGTFEKNLDKAVQDLMADIKNLVKQPASADGSGS